MARLIALFWLLSLLGCNSDQQSANPLKEVTPTPPEFIKEDSLLRHPFEAFPKRGNLVKMEGTLKQSVLETMNPHVKGQIDSISTLQTKGGSRFQFYVSKDDELLLEVELKDSSVALSHGLKIGMAKDLFLQRFNNEAYFFQDTIRFLNESETDHLEYVFVGNKLERVLYRSYLD